MGEATFAASLSQEPIHETRLLARRLVGCRGLCRASACRRTQGVCRALQADSSRRFAGTKAYTPTKLEKEATKDWTEKELESGSPEVETLKGKKDRRIAWFGIVRDIKEDKQKKQTRLLVEMKYFDGMTDTPPPDRLAFRRGRFSSGDSRRGAQPEEPLTGPSLWQSDGRSRGRAAGVGRVRSLLGLGTLCLHALRKRQEQSQWVKLRKVKADDMNVYSSRPDQQYYEDRLGKGESETPPNAKAATGS